MKKSKMIILALALVLGLGSLTACGQVTSQKEEVGAYTVTDMLGRQVDLDKVPERIIAISPSDAENLHALGLSDKIVAVGTYVDFPEEVAKLPKVASGQDLNVEEILSNKPDLVLMSDMAQTPAQVDSLTQAGVKVLMTNAKSLEEVYKAIDLIGQAMGAQDKANQVVNNMKGEMDKLAQNKEALKGKKVYFEISPLEYGLWSGGKGTFVDEISANLGLENIFSDIDQWAEVSQEEVIARKPDYIVTIGMGTTQGPSPVEEILGRKGWEDIPAIKNKKVLHLKNDELSRPSVRLLEGAKLLDEFVGE